jgi:hypothetical protein
MKNFVTLYRSTAVTTTIDLDLDTLDFASFLEGLRECGVDVSSIQSKDSLINYLRSDECEVGEVFDFVINNVGQCKPVDTYSDESSYWASVEVKS